MSLPPKIDHGISLNAARKYARNFQAQAGEQTIKGGLFWKESIEKLISQPGCVAMRYYYGQQENGAPVLVLVGVDAQGKDMTKGFIAEMSWPCPPFCGWDSVLNTTVRYRKRVDLRTLVPMDGDRTVTTTKKKSIPVPVKIAALEEKK